MKVHKKKPTPIRIRKIFTQVTKGAIYMRDSIDGIPMIKKIKVELIFNKPEKNEYRFTFRLLSVSSRCVAYVPNSRISSF